MHKIKKCSKCGLEKIVTLFSKDLKNKDGFSYWCKQCHREHGKAMRAKAKGKKTVNNPPKTLKPSKKPKTSGIETTIILDFSDYPELLKMIKEASESSFRSPDMELIWLLHENYGI